jgi:hypothetical protein
MRTLRPKVTLMKPRVGKGFRVRTQGKRAVAPRVRLPSTKGAKVKVR